MYIFKAIDEIVNADEVDMKIKVKGDGIRKNLLSFDFIYGFMFMRIILRKKKLLTQQLQEEELNILDAFKLIDATVENLSVIRKRNGNECAARCYGRFCRKIRYRSNIGIQTLPQS